jgi:hypothetical protein
MAKRRKAQGKLQPRKGLLPGEYKRLSTVQVERLDRNGAVDPLYRDTGSDMYSTHNYIVQTHRLDTVWSYTIEVEGARWRIPGKVMEAMVRHKESIIKDHKRRVSVERHARTKAKTEATQDEAERIADLQGA